MFKPQALLPSYLLHQRAYRDTSLLVEVLTRSHGRITAVAKGARAPKSKAKGMLQPFTPLLASFVGKTELLTLCTIEASGKAPLLRGESLFSAMYLNELLVRTLHRFDPSASLYDVYENTLQKLSETSKLQEILRQFEKCLLQELGYALVLDREANTDAAVLPDNFYWYAPQRGVIFQRQDEVALDNPAIFSGASLLALHQGVFETSLQLRDAKRLMRMALAPLLGDKPLKSRELFIQV